MAEDAGWWCEAVTTVIKERINKRAMNLLATAEDVVLATMARIMMGVPTVLREVDKGKGPACSENKSSSPD